MTSSSRFCSRVTAAARRLAASWRRELVVLWGRAFVECTELAHVWSGRMVQSAACLEAAAVDTALAVVEHLFDVAAKWAAAIGRWFIPSEISTEATPATRSDDEPSAAVDDMAPGDVVEAVDAKAKKTRPVRPRRRCSILPEPSRARRSADTPPRAKRSAKKPSRAKGSAKKPLRAKRSAKKPLRAKRSVEKPPRTRRSPDKSRPKRSAEKLARAKRSAEKPARAKRSADTPLRAKPLEQKSPGPAKREVDAPPRGKRLAQKMPSRPKREADDSPRAKHPTKAPPYPKRLADELQSAKRLADDPSRVKPLAGAQDQSSTKRRPEPVRPSDPRLAQDQPPAKRSENKSSRTRRSQEAAKQGSLIPTSTRENAAKRRPSDSKSRRVVPRDQPIRNAPVVSAGRKTKTPTARDRSAAATAPLSGQRSPQPAREAPASTTKLQHKHDRKSGAPRIVSEANRSRELGSVASGKKRLPAGAAERKKRSAPAHRSGDGLPLRVDRIGVVDSACELGATRADDERTAAFFGYFLVQSVFAYVLAGCRRHQEFFGKLLGEIVLGVRRTAVRIWKKCIGVVGAAASLALDLRSIAHFRLHELPLLPHGRPIATDRNAIVGAPSASDGCKSGARSRGSARAARAGGSKAVEEPSISDAAKEARLSRPPARQRDTPRGASDPQSPRKRSPPARPAA
jgi:hypothetical protein